MELHADAAALVDALNGFNLGGEQEFGDRLACSKSVHIFLEGFCDLGFCKAVRVIGKNMYTFEPREPADVVVEGIPQKSVTIWNIGLLRDGCRSGHVYININ